MTHNGAIESTLKGNIHIETRNMDDKIKTQSVLINRVGSDTGYSCSPVSRHIVLMCTNVIISIIDLLYLLNCVPEHDSLTFFVLRRTKCK